MAKISKNSVALAGEFATLSQLTLRGFNAAMTLGHTKEIDILVHNPDSGAPFQVEVKTNLEKRRGPSNSKLFGKFVTDWQMDVKHETINRPDLFYCFVHINNNPSESLEYDFRYFIIPSNVVAKYVQDQHFCWLKADPIHKDSPRRLFRIGLENDRPIEVPAPLASDWENNWKFRREPLSKDKERKSP